MTAAAPSRNWGAKHAGAKGRVGTYACSGEGGRIIRVGVPEGVDKPPRSLIIDPCPACHGPHRAAISWRRPTVLDEGREPDLILDVALPDPIGLPGDEGGR